MKPVIVLVTVLVLLALLVSSVSANIIVDPPNPLPTGVASDGVTINDKGTIVGDIEIDPSAQPIEQISLNNIIALPPRPTG